MDGNLTYISNVQVRMLDMTDGRALSIYNSVVMGATPSVKSYVIMHDSIIAGGDWDGYNLVEFNNNTVSDLDGRPITNLGFDGMNNSFLNLNDSISIKNVSMQGGSFNATVQADGELNLINSYVSGLVSNVIQQNGINFMIALLLKLVLNMQVLVVFAHIIAMVELSPLHNQVQKLK